MSGNRAVAAVAITTLALFVVATGTAAAEGPAPGCVRYIVVDSGIGYRTVDVINDCLVPHTLRLDLAFAPDSECVYIPPKERRRVDIDSESYPIGKIRGVVDC